MWANDQGPYILHPIEDASQATLPHNPVGLTPALTSLRKFTLTG